MNKSVGSLIFLSMLLMAAAQTQAHTICEVQAYDPATGLSPLNGQTVTVTGVITVPRGIFVAQYTSMFIRGIGDDVCGVNVFSFDPPQGSIELGDTVTISGTVTEYILTGGDGATTEITFGVGGLTNIRKSDTVYVEPEFMATGAVGHEENEGRLVRVKGKVTSRTGSREMTVSDGTGDITIFDMARTFESDPDWQNLFIGDVVTVTGIVSQAGPGPPYLSGYSIWPRSPEPPFEDVVVPRCIPDTTTTRAHLEVTDLEGNRVSIFCPECPGSDNTVLIRYTGPNTWRTKLRIYDSYGRCVATLDDYPTLCGQTEIEWTGRNELMEALPMGLYHLVVTSTDPRTGDVSQETVPLVIGKRLR